MFEANPGLENQLGPWLAVVVGALWLIMLTLLSLHVVKRRLGLYGKSQKPVSGSSLWSLNILIILLVVLLTLAGVWAFSPTEVSWYARVGVLSGLFALLGIVIAIREGLALRKKSFEKKG